MYSILNKVWLISILFLGGALLAIAPPTAFAGSVNKKLNVLFISSFSKNIPAQAYFETGLDEALGFSKGQNNLFFEFMDNPRLKNENFKRVLAQYLEEKYEDIEFDFVVAWGEIASIFLSTNHLLFEGANRVYVEAEWAELFRERSQTEKETLIVIEDDYRAAIQEVLKLEHPIKFYVIGTTTDLEAQSRLRLFRNSITGETAKLQIEYLLDQTLEQVAAKLEGLSRKDAAAFYLLMFSNGQGTSMTPYAVAQKLAARSAIPIYSFWESLMGSGVVGGYVLSFERVGFHVGETILSNIRGKSVRAFSPMRHVYDWKALQRWKISENKVPAGAVILNRPPDLLAQYKWHFLAVAILIIALSSLSFLLSKALTRSKRAEVALSLSENNLKSIQEVARIGGFIFDIPNDKLKWFEGTKQVLGVPVETRLSYRAFLRIIHPDDRQYVDTIWQAALKGTPSDIEYRVIGGDQLKWVSAKVEVEFDRLGQPLLAKGFLQDVSERKKSEEEAARLRNDLAHVTRVSTVGQLGQNIAHEVNQPLAAIAANAEAAMRLMEEPKPNLNEVREALGDIVSDQKRASEVVKRIRTLVRKETTVLKRVDLNSLAGDAVKLVQGDAVARNARILLDLDADLPTVWGDQVQLQQVVINLLVNALDALDHVASATRLITVKSGCARAGGATLSVSDTGVGIETETAGRLFEPFFTTKTQGMGLGLSISRSIVEAHGGTIRAAANGDGGATFYVSLPVVSPECAEGYLASCPRTGV
ncbi:MAG: ATP-binding protein [Desulfobacterales bacterium]|jgi:signal transduction histidine kinase